jgi:hypothetical protein
MDGRQHWSHIINAYIDPIHHHPLFCMHHNPLTIQHRRPVHHIDPSHLDELLAHPHHLADRQADVVGTVGGPRR